MTNLILNGVPIESQEQLVEEMAKMKPLIVKPTLYKHEVVNGLRDLIAAYGEKGLPDLNFYAPVDLIVWDCIAAAGLADFAEEIFGKDLYGKIKAQVESEHEA